MESRPFNGLKVVDIKKGEIRHAIRKFSKNLSQAKNVILIIEQTDNNLWAYTTCAEESHTVTILQKMQVRYLQQV